MAERERLRQSLDELQLIAYNPVVSAFKDYLSIRLNVEVNPDVNFVEPETLTKKDLEGYEPTASVIYRWENERGDAYEISCVLRNGFRNVARISGGGTISPITEISLNNPNLKKEIEESIENLFWDPEGYLRVEED